MKDGYVEENNPEDEEDEDNDELFQDLGDEGEDMLYGDDSLEDEE